MGDSTLVAWTAATGLVAAAVALDAYVLRRGTPSSRRAAAWSVLWLAAGLLVIPLVAAAAGPGNAGRYATVYVIERALSLDNLFVIVVLLGAFAIPREYRDRVLTWGIVGALVTRAAAILGGVELIDRIDWLVYPLAGLLLILALRTVRASPSRSAPRAARPEMPRLLRRVLPVSAELEGSRLVIRRAGRRHATPLLVCIVAIVGADVAFAVDSVPAALAITHDPLLIWVANACSLLGLRALVELVDELRNRLRYIDHTLAALLVVAAAQLGLQHLLTIPVGLTLAVVGTVLLAGIGISLRMPQRARRNTGPPLSSTVE